MPRLLAPCDLCACSLQGMSKKPSSDPMTRTGEEVRHSQCHPRQWQWRYPKDPELVWNMCLWRRKVKDAYAEDSLRVLLARASDRYVAVHTDMNVHVQWTCTALVFVPYCCGSATYMYLWEKRISDSFFDRHVPSVTEWEQPTLAWLTDLPKKVTLLVQWRLSI